MTTDLEQQVEAAGNEPANAGSFSERFGRYDRELDALVAELSDSIRSALGHTLDQIRRAPIHLRPTLAIAIPLVLNRDGFPAAKMHSTLAGIRALIEAFPDGATPARSTRRHGS
jgi:hypothetical protein